MTDWPADIIVSGVQPWLWVPRQHPISLIIIHSTRGGSASKDTEFQGSINWVKSSGNNQGGWGGSFSRLIGGNGEHARILRDDQQPTWSAGWGDSGTAWPIDRYAISYELAQPWADDPFTDAQYGRFAHEVAKDCKEYEIWPVMLPYLSQRGDVPSGITRHDNCANGTKLGKSDPGLLFDETRFMDLLRQEMEEDMTEEQIIAIIAKHLGETPETFKERWQYQQVRETIRVAAAAVIADPDSVEAKRRLREVAVFYLDNERETPG